VRDHPWIDLQWGFDLVLYLLHKIGGPALLCVVAAIGFTLAILFVLRLARPHLGDVPASCLAFLVIVAAQDNGHVVIFDVASGREERSFTQQKPTKCALSPDGKLAAAAGWEDVVKAGGVDLSKFDLEAPLPDIQVNNARVSAVQSYIAISRREGLTLRQMAMRSAAAKHHWTLIGSVKQVADELESWFRDGAADGFNVLPSDVPGAINALVDKLVPELQRRGLFHTEYEGKTLRENLGLSRPADRSRRA
jgi:hypothetical protein